MQLTLTLPGGDVQELGEFSPAVQDGDQDVGFSTGLHVPASAQPGIAIVRDDQRRPEIFKFKVG